MPKLRPTLIALLAVAGLGLASRPARADTPAAAALALAGQLQSAGRYAGCATEALRSWWLEPTQPPEIPLELATQCLLQDQQWAAAQRILRDPRFATVVQSSAPLLVRACLLDALQTPTKPQLAQCTAGAATQPKLAYLEPIRLLWHGRWLQALRVTEGLAPHPETAEWAKDVARWAAQAHALPDPSPGGAALLSAIVPGAGRMYTGKWQDGLSSLVLVGLPAWFAVGGFERDGVASARGWLLGTTASVLYLGNIYGSYIGAAAVADKARRQWQARVRQGVRQWVVP